MTANGPRILTLDIETSPAKAWVWSLWGENIPLARLIEPTRVICFAAKWYGEKRVLFYSEFHHGREAMLNAAFELLSEADVVVTYNGDKFDLPHLNREFAEEGMGRVAPYHSVDLFKVGKKHMKFLSHKLAHITNRLKLSGKLENGVDFELWEKCLAGDERAWRTMRRYNKRDVVTTEELFVFWLPYLDSLPALTLYVDDDRPRCSKCLSEDIERRGFQTTKLGKYQRYQCQACGSWMRGARRVEGVDLR